MLFKAILWLAWLALGMLVLIRGDISRASYALVWGVMLMYMLLDMME